MELRESDRLGVRLLALNLRLAELDHEMRRTAIEVNHLEARLEDARFANIVGESAGDPAEIAPELERSRTRLDSQRELVERVKKSQWKARVAHTLMRVKERREDRERGGDA